MRSWIPIVPVVFCSLGACAEGASVPSAVDGRSAGEYGTSSEVSPGPAPKGASGGASGNDYSGNTGGTGAAGNADTQDAGGGALASGGQDGSAGPGTGCASHTECNDDNPCTDDVCGGNAECVYLNVEGACDDGLECTTADSCSSGRCLGANNCADGQACDLERGICVTCAENVDCDDNNPCTDDICDQGTCSYVDNTASCDDNVDCTEGDSCSAGSCGGGAPNDTLCGDDNVCTDDVCSSAGCQWSDNSAVCDDGIDCTADTCSAGSCVGADTCGDGWVCDTGGGQCVEVDCPSLLAGSVLFEGHCYHFDQGEGGMLDNAHGDWDETKSYCQGLGANWKLAVLESAAENDFVNQHIWDYDGGEPDGNWCFGHRQSGDVWQGVNGEGIGQWASGQLSGGGDDCASMVWQSSLPSSGDNWQKVDCDWDDCGAICEYTP